jgi:GNAT superfamily N-acetyltransferase
MMQLDPKQTMQFTLQDGTHVLLRPVMPEDKERIQNGMAALSLGSRYFRFITPAARLSDQQLSYFSEVDQCGHVAWVALDSSDPKHPGLGVARFIRIKEEPTVAEVALTVIDAYQRRGLGTILLALLYLIAETQEFQTLRAAVVDENTTMLKWLRNLGAAGSCERGEYRLNLSVHRDLARLPQTPSGEKFKHAIEAVQTAFHEHHTYEKHT